jgi:SET domain-containing protein
MSSKKKKKSGDREIHQKLLALWNRGQSPYCEVRGSDIHGRGVYATTFIPKDTKIIEYVGEPIDKKESERRARRQQSKSVKSGDAAVYIFNLTKNYDLDGNLPWNTARLINHSCAPNCEAFTTGRRIFIHALRDIQPGEELSFDYGFDVDCYEDHPCRCGTPFCVGYIVSRSQWKDLHERLTMKDAKKKRKSRKSA